MTFGCRSCCRRAALSAPASTAERPSSCTLTTKRSLSAISSPSARAHEHGLTKRAASQDVVDHSSPRGGRPCCGVQTMSLLPTRDAANQAAAWNHCLPGLPNACSSRGLQVGCPAKVNLTLGKWYITHKCMCPFIMDATHLDLTFASLHFPFDVRQSALTAPSLAACRHGKSAGALAVRPQPHSRHARHRSCTFHQFRQL